MSSISSTFNRGAERLFDVSRNADIIIMGDSDHRQTVISEFMASNDFIKEAQQNNVKKIAIELPTAFQGVFDAYHQGNLSQDALKFVLDKALVNSHVQGDERDAYINNITNLCARGRDNGIRVLAVDGYEGYVQTDNGLRAVELFDDPEKKRLLTEMGHAYDKATAAVDAVSTSPPGRQRHFDAVFEEKYGRKTNELKDFIADELYDKLRREGFALDERMRQDIHLAERVSTLHKATDGRTLVLYGAGHTMHGENDLDASLRRTGLNVQVFDIFPQGVDCMALTSPATHGGCGSYAIKTTQDLAEPERHYLDMRDGVVHQYPPKAQKMSGP